MGKLSACSFVRHVAAPALLLAISFIFSAAPAPSVARDRLPSVSTQPYAYSGSGRAKALRPARMQMRTSKAPAAEGKNDSKDARDFGLGLSAFRIEPASAAPRSTCIASSAPLVPFRFRKRHPRDPPVCAA